MRLTDYSGIVLAALMAMQASLGLLVPHQYRDAEWIKATWWGNDLVTLTVVVPLLLGVGRAAARRSVRYELLRTGTLAYAAYNGAYYVFGAALNVFFPLYVVVLVVSLALLALALHDMDPARVLASFDTATPVRAAGGTLVFIGAGLGAAWLGMWAAWAVAGRPTPIAPELFKVVAAIDLTAIVPGLIVGGVLLWRQRPFGYVLATVWAVLGSAYLLVLSVNSVVAIDRGFADAPGEVPIWSGLWLLTTVTLGALLRHCAPRRALRPARASAESPASATART